MKKYVFFLLSLLFSGLSFSQNVGIGTTTPDASAQLDIYSTTKGLLAPRMTKTQRNTIVSPATGLLIYQTDNNPGFYYYTGTSWKAVSPGGNSGWSLTGNSGTDPLTNFLGTTDNLPLSFRVNNTRAGYLSSNGNSFWGISSGINNTTGYSNVAIGNKALYMNSDGNNLVAIGDSALYNNVGITHNTAIGSKALYSNTSGWSNTAIGYRTLYNDTSGYNNTANGNLALFSNTTGYENTANGLYALYSNTTGNYNTANGLFTLFSNTTGSYNTAIGYYAGVSYGDLTNATAIGANAVVNASNKIRIGNSSVTVIEGQVAWSFPSDARFKYNIKENVPGLDFITKLKPVTYYFDTKKLDTYTKTGIIDNSIIHPVNYTGEEELHTGFLAQDVEKIADKLGYHFDGIHKPANDRDHYSLAYSQFIMPLVKAVQEQQEMIKSQQDKITEQQKINEELKAQIEQNKNQQQKLIESLQAQINALKNK